MHSIDYQKTLRDMAKSMVRLRRPERLLKMITRFIDRELGLTHTSLLVLDEKRNCFTFVDSKGSRRVPLGLVKIDADHPLVSWFQETPKNVLKEDCLRRAALADPRAAKAMDDLKAELVIPGYFKEKLLGLLLLGKKSDGGKFTDEEISFFQILAQDCSMAVKTAEYHESLVEKNRELERRIAEIEKFREKERATFFQIIRSLGNQVHAKDDYTFGHVCQVERLGMMTAKEMGIDVSGPRGDVLSAGLILHDVGKIGIPDSILKKPGPLTADEWKVMRTHVEKGLKILEHLTDFKEVAQIVGCHHEYYNGMGYPHGLRGEEIPLEARIVSVVDAFHAMVSNRCYSKSRPVEFAVTELGRCAGSQFDPKVVEAFVRALKKEMKARGVGSFSEKAA